MIRLQKNRKLSVLYLFGKSGRVSECMFFTSLVFNFVYETVKRDVAYTEFCCRFFVLNEKSHIFWHFLLFAEMNRHHYAMFVRNCRLILLLRRDFSEGDLNIFRPAEWRWKLPQVLSLHAPTYKLPKQLSATRNVFLF